MDKIKAKFFVYLETDRINCSTLKLQATSGYSWYGNFLGIQERTEIYRIATLEELIDYCSSIKH